MLVMVLSLIILVLVGSEIYRGFQNGLIIELTGIFSYLVAWGLALAFAGPFSTWLRCFLPATRTSLLNGISFLILFVIITWLCRLAGRWLNGLAWLPVIHQLNTLGGAVVGGLIGCLVVTILINLCLLLPSNLIHQQYQQSMPAQVMTNRVPGISHQLMMKWLK